MALKISTWISRCKNPSAEKITQYATAFKKTQTNQTKQNEQTNKTQKTTKQKNWKRFQDCFFKRKKPQLAAIK